MRDDGRPIEEARMSISKREFLKISGLSVTAAVAASATGPDECDC